MPNAFNFSASPFDCLTTAEQKLVREGVDIAYFPEGEAILDTGFNPTHLFVIIKGYVKQFDGEDLVTTYGPDDTFDGRSLVSGRVSSRFVAAEEVVAYQLPKEAVSELISRNATFGALLFSDLSKKLSAIAERQSAHELQSLTMARVEEAFLRPPNYVPAAMDIVSVVRAFRENRSTNVLVRDDASQPPRVGIFTTTGLQRAILHGKPLGELTVGEVATFPLITVRPEDYLFDALAAMIRHKVHRVVVADGEKITGVLEQLDLLSFLSNHSFLITLQIGQSRDLASLRQAALQITRLITLLHRGGTKVSLIAKLVQELNAKLFERAWQLIAPPELVLNSCLFVMGSEGRGEQLLKTDQDNGLVIRDGYAPPADLADICERFSEALRSFGYPDCPGRIMVSNPKWCQSTAAFSAMVRHWLMLPDAESLMELAIFMDADAVCGDDKLLEAVRGEIFKLVAGGDSLLGHFASAIDTFAESTGWWNRILSLGGEDKDTLNLKKIGIFPLVHGVRSMALEQRLRETSTADRIKALVASGKFGREMGEQLIETLQFFMTLRLKAGLAELDLGRPVSGGVQVDSLTSLDRSLLKDALAEVKRFKGTLRYRYHLDTM